jgi:hypothetical protein
MSNFQPPDPILDARERDLISNLAADWEKFSSSGIVARSLTTVFRKIQEAYLTGRKARFLSRQIPLLLATDQLGVRPLLGYDVL